MLPKTIPDKLPGAVLPQFVCCGKPNCRCARGWLHGPYWYRFWREDNLRLRKEYVRATEVEAVRVACAKWRAEQAEGRQVIRLGTELLDWLGDDQAITSPLETAERVFACGQAVRGLFEYADGTKGDWKLRVKAMRALGRFAAPSPAAGTTDALDLLRVG